MAQPQGQTLFSALTDQTVRTDPPLLVSSWPYHGSKITLIGDNGLHGFGLSLLSGTLSDTRTLPIILYFNQAVKGISSSTVAIKSELLKEELVWKPLSMNNSNTAQVWVVYLNLANLELQLLKTYSVEINIGHSKGIVSSNGNHYGDPSQISFKVFVQTSYTELTEGQGGKRTTWMDTNLQKIDHFQESDSIVTADQNHHIPTSNWCTEEIVQEITKFQDLLSDKIGRLTLARLLTALDMLSSQHDGRKSNTEEVLQLYTDMMKLDPTHSIYYKDECSLISLKRITSTRDSLIPYCHYYKDATETVSGNVCLRLQNLSLSRIGSIQNLLWVQMLDLSHNELRPIEVIINFGSFTALGPLRLLKSLKVLNNSYNELGSHSIDTMRYLSSSPVAHTEEFAKDRFEILTGSFSATKFWGVASVKANILGVWPQTRRCSLFLRSSLLSAIMLVNLTTPKFWEAFLIFGNLALTELNITGNAVADENFRSFLVKVLPTLTWLGDEELS
ncbi:Geranylgeranyl transferase type-2 subunit alpha 1 [Glycine max]|nr:Geranylgeranyl transferase type-2 subunit alpha 1 [Glycine max]